ncbi:MAG: TolC family outer membrane protein [Burkholderiales bacterium]
MRKRNALFAVLLFIGGSSQAFGADLVEIYRLGLRNDPKFEVARYSLKAAQEKYPQAIAGLLPTLNASGVNNSTRAQNEYSNAPAVDRKVHAWNWSLQLTQPLFRLQNLFAYDEAKIILEQAQAQYTLAEQDMILRTTQAYFEVMASREGIKVAESEIAATQEQLALSKRGFEKGVVAITDVYDGQSRLDLAQARLVAARSELDAKTTELSKIVDEVPEKLAALDPSVFIPTPQPNDLSTWVKQAQENNAAVKAAQFALLATETVVKKTKSEHLPTVDLVASYGENYSTGSTVLQTDFASRGLNGQIGVQVNVPLFAGGGVSSKVSEAIANKYRVGAELEVARRQASTDARLAFAGVVNGMAQINAIESAVKSGQKAIDGNRAGYKLGIYSNINVLNAEQQFYASKRDLIKARYDTLLQALKLKAAAGNLSEADLLSTNALLSSGNPVSLETAYTQEVERGLKIDRTLRLGN